MDVKRERTRKKFLVNFLGVGEGEIRDGRGAGGQWLDQLVWQTHELCPELVSRLGVGMRGGQPFLGSARGGKVAFNLG